MNETTEQRVTPEPTFMAEAWPHKREYWTCAGFDKKQRTPFWKRKIAEIEFYRIAFYYKEDAEAHAAIPCNYWTWGGKPAVTTTLSGMMSSARREGNRGVKILAFDQQTRQWIVAKEYRADEPLPEELR